MTSHADLAERYKRLRAVSFQLNTILPGRACKETLERAARKLGLWGHAGVVLGKLGEVNVLMDYVIYDCYEDGANAVDRYIARRPPAPGSDEEAVLRAKQRAFYAIVQVEELLVGLGVRVRDLLTGRRFLLADIGFSATAAEGLVLATRLLPFEDFVMSSGAALPLDAKTLTKVASEVIMPAPGDGPQVFDRLSRQQKADITAGIIRLALESGALDSIDYVHVDEAKGPDAGTYVSADPIRSASTRVGRNDPCPCGSGKKYKKCCGR